MLFFSSSSDDLFSRFEFDSPCAWNKQKETAT